MQMAPPLFLAFLGHLRISIFMAKIKYHNYRYPLILHMFTVLEGEGRPYVHLDMWISIQFW